MSCESQSLEERLQADRTGKFHREIAAQLTALQSRLESEKRKLHERSEFKKITAAETAVVSAQAVIQLFEASIKNQRED